MRGRIDITPTPTIENALKRKEARYADTFWSGENGFGRGGEPVLCRWLHNYGAPREMLDSIEILTAAEEAGEEAPLTEEIDWLTDCFTEGQLRLYPRIGTITEDEWVDERFGALTGKRAAWLAKIDEELAKREPNPNP